MAYNVQYQRVAGQYASGATFEHEVKAWVYADGCVRWELRRILDWLGYTGRSLDMSAFFRKLRSQIDAQDYAAIYAKVVPSRKSLRTRGEDCDSDYVRDEWQIETESLLLLLVALRHR